MSFTTVRQGVRQDNWLEGQFWADGPRKFNPHASKIEAYGTAQKTGREGLTVRRLKAREEEEKIYTKSTESVDDTAEQDAEKCARRKKLKPIRFKGVTPGLKPRPPEEKRFFSRRWKPCADESKIYRQGVRCGRRGESTRHKTRCCRAGHDYGARARGLHGAGWCGALYVRVGSGAGR